MSLPLALLRVRSLSLSLSLPLFLSLTLDSSTCAGQERRAPAPRARNSGPLQGHGGEAVADSAHSSVPVLHIREDQGRRDDRSPRRGTDDGGLRGQQEALSLPLLFEACRRARAYVADVTLARCASVVILLFTLTT